MEKDDVFITKLDIGSFIVLATLVAELLIFPLFETLKDRLTNAIVIHKIANSQQVVLRSDKWWSHWLGVSDNIKTDRFSFRLAYLLKLLFKTVIIGMLVYWESSANEVTIARLSDQQLAQGKTKLDGIRLMSPMPFTGLSENEIIGMVTFRPYGVEQNGTYVVLDGEKFTFTGDEACTSVTEGRLTIYLSRIDIEGTKINNICLDGTEGRPTEIAAELNIQSRNQRTYSLSALTLESFVATDDVTVIYAVSTSHNEKAKEGYAALTKNSHQNGNTVWSLYGVLHGKDDNNLEYLNIPIINVDQKPCGDSQIGTWRFLIDDDAKETIICPDGTKLQAPTGTNSAHVVDADWVIPSTERLPREPSELALQWVAETPFSDYVAKTKLTEEIWSRMNRQVFFVSDFTGTIPLPEAETVQYTQTSRKRVIITTATLCAILLMLVIFLIAERIAMSKHNIKMDFCGIGSVLGMWNSDYSGEPTCADGSTMVSIGLTQSGDVGPQHIGTCGRPGKPNRSIDEMEQQADTKVGGVRRDPKRPLE